jgi:hypothetical protein
MHIVNDQPSPFEAAVREINAMGWHVSMQATDQSVAYAVITGRSNARWWFIPISNWQIAVSGMALFQPTLPGARLIKQAAICTSRLGLTGIWARKKIYLTGSPWLTDVLQQQGLHYAFFTGTHSPHRKLTVQIMDAAGQIKAFAKASLSPAVAKLLNHEANTLAQLATLSLNTANIPAVMFAGQYGGVSVLLTDTLKTSTCTSPAKLVSQHIEFLRELTEKTAKPQDGKTVRALELKYSQVAHKLLPDWRLRFEKCLGWLGSEDNQLLPTVLTHGDFTPWNTFLVNGKLYVFDWEYAETDYPSSNDLIHFLLATPGLRSLAAAEQIQSIVQQVMSIYQVDSASAKRHIMVYLLSQTLRYVQRIGGSDNLVETWDGASENAEFIDSLNSEVDQT